MPTRRRCTARRAVGPAQLLSVWRGWNVTGDTCAMEADGYFWCHARSDDMITCSGYNIAGLEVAAALLLHPGVAACACPDERGDKS